MKKSIIALSCFIAVLSCKPEEKVELVNLKGDFIFLEDAAVIQSENDVYAVKIDEKSKELAQKVEPLKVEEFDMIPVEVAGVVKDNPNTEGWEKIIEIKEIVNVSSSRKPSKLKMN